jgi:DNA mismatch endonuclease (patch repair protein)
LRALKRAFRPAHREFWVGKILRNVKRDRKQTAELKALGWTVLRLWERDILRNPNKAAQKIRSTVRRCSAEGSRINRK